MPTDSTAPRRAQAGLSDTLLIFLLKARNPARFDDRLPIQTDRQFSEMSRDELKEYIAARLGLEQPALERELSEAEGEAG